MKKFELRLTKLEVKYGPARLPARVFVTEVGESNQAAVARILGPEGAHAYFAASRANTDPPDIFITPVRAELRPWKIGKEKPQLAGGIDRGQADQAKPKLGDSIGEERRCRAGR